MAISGALPLEATRPAPPVVLRLNHEVHNAPNFSKIGQSAAD